MSELETLIPAPVELTLDGETLVITPIKIGKLPAMARACAPFISVFKKRLSPSPPLPQAGEGWGEGSTSINWLDLIADHGEGVFTALAIATGKPQKWIEDLTADDAIQLAQAVIEVNADFFIRRVLPAVTAAASGMAQKITVGATPFKA